LPGCRSPGGRVTAPPRATRGYAADARLADPRQQLGADRGHRPRCGARRTRVGGSAGEGVEAGDEIGERVVAVGDRARPPGEIAVAQLAGDATARVWHVGIVVGAAVAGRQGALGDEPGAVALGVLD
jgi:hypothetical protein